MTAAYLIAGVLLVLVILWDTFETVVLPRTVTRKVRLSRYYYSLFWRLFASIASCMRSRRRREALLAIHAPLSLLMLLGLWAFCLILGFAFIYEALDHHHAQPGHGFSLHLYLSGSTFFTLGLGDEKPISPGARFAAVTEAGIGFGFLAVVISYLPVLYTAFSRREATVSLLMSRAGTPPSATMLIERYARDKRFGDLRGLLERWEQWSAELLENYISYPVLAYYRSQDDRHSWLAALTVVLDASSLLQVEMVDDPEWEDALCGQAELTYSMAVRTVVVLAVITNAQPVPNVAERLTPERLEALRKRMSKVGVHLNSDCSSLERLTRLRAAYEPDVHALAARLLLDLPPVVVEPDPGQGEPERTAQHAAKLL